MISDRENFLRITRGEQRAFVPVVMNLVQLVKPSVFIDKPGGDVPGTDGFGRRWIKPDNQPVIPDYTQGPLLDDICDWESQVHWPRLEEQDWAAAARRDISDRDPNRIIMVQLTSGPFERLHDLMGFEEALEATITDPGECEAFFSKFCDFRIEQLGYIKKYYDPDLIQFHDDWGSQNDLMFNPDFWRKAIMPNIKRVIDACHEMGMLFNLHTCGKVDRIIDDIVAMGPDMIDSMMVCNDLDYWMDTYGKQVIFMGGLDNQGIIDREDASWKDIRLEVKNRIKRYASKGNYMPMTYCTGSKAPVALLYAAWYGYTFDGGVLKGLPLFLRLLLNLRKIKAELDK